MNVLNLYSGIGGNRKYWQDVNVVAVEKDAAIAKIYKDAFPNDTVIVGDAHEYLLNHYKDFNFIWSSPPCQTHSNIRQNLCVGVRGTKAVYPDLKLYEEIIFLKYNSKCNWVVENVRPYYEPLIKPTKILQRHCFWSNFDITDTVFEKDYLRKSQIDDLQSKYGYDLSSYKLSNKRQVLRNCTNPDIGLHILEAAKN